MLLSLMISMLPCFAETWLKDSIPDQAIAVVGYRLLRRDRTLKSHGGVCIYVKNFIYCHPLNDFYNDDFEVHWSLLRPCRLPRGISNIIVAVVYHPLNSDNSSMMEYLRESLERIEHTVLIQIVLQL